MSTQQAIQTRLNNNAPQGINIMNTVNPAFNLNAFLTAAQDTSTDFISTVLDQFHAEGQAAGIQEIKSGAGKAIAAIRAYNLKKNSDKLGDTQLKHQVLHSVMQLAKSWMFLVQVNSPRFTPSVITIGNKDYEEGRKTIAEYNRDCLAYVLAQTGNGDEALATFDKFMVEILGKFRLATDEEIDRVKSLSVEAKADRKKLRLVTPYTGAGVNLMFTRFATMLFLNKGQTITIGNVEVTAKRDRRFSISSSDLVNGSIESLDRVVIHNEVIQDNNGRSAIFPTVGTSEVNGRLNKLFLLKMNKISFDKLNTPTKRKVLSISDAGKLKDLAYPAVNLPSVYGNTGFVSSSEAESGYVNDRIDVACLADFVGEGMKSGVITSGDVNKAVSRNDKLEKDSGWALGKQNCFIVIDATDNKGFEDFGPAPIIGNRKTVLRTGLARVTSRMIEGGIKAVMNYHSSNENGPVIVSPAAFKGGILSAMMITLFKDTNLTISQLFQLANNNPAFLASAYAQFESTCTTMNFMGRELRGFYADLELSVSNAYFVEEWKYTGEDVDVNELEVMMSRSEDIFAQGNKVPSALRDKVMAMVVADPTFSAVEYIKELHDKGEIVPKKPVTRYTSSLFSQIAQWHGVDVAENLIDSLISRLPVEEKATKKMAMTILRGEKNPKNVRTTVNIEQVVDILLNSYIKSKELPMEDVDTYSLDVLESINTLLLGDRKLIQDKATYFKVVFGNQEILVPANKMFYDQIKETGTKFLATGFLKDLLKAAKGCIEVGTNGSIKHNPSSVKVEGIFFEAEIQRRLFGKNLGYIETYGTYQIMLNKLGGSTHRSEVYMTELSLVSKEKGNVVRVNSVKHPAYFKDASASFTVVSFSFGDSLVDFAYRKAAFMSTYTIMITEDDVDGDARQFSDDGFVLPSFQGPSKEFNGKEFLTFLKDEQVSCKIVGTELNLKATSMHKFHLALQGVSSAKANIGLFTASKYKYEATLSGLVGQAFEGTDGDFYNVTEHDVYVICNTLSRLVQTEAMDNVKQNANNFDDKFISELTAPHKFTTGLYVPSNGDVLQVRNDYVVAIAARLQNELFNRWNVDAGFGMTMAQALCKSALLIEAKGTKYMNLFSNRFQAKRTEEILMNIATRADHQEFNVSGYDLTDSADAGSMYAYVLNKFLAL